MLRQVSSTIFKKVQAKAAKANLKLNIDNPSNCLYCGRQLSVLQGLRDPLYCSNSHQSAHSRELNNLGLLRLQAEPKSPSEIRWEKCERRMRAEDLRRENKTSR